MASDNTNFQNSENWIYFEYLLVIIFIEIADTLISDILHILIIYFAFCKQESDL